MAQPISSTVHHAIARSADKSKESKTRSFTVKISDDTISTAKQICERNGTSLAAFLRECVEILVEDYIRPQIDQE